MIIDTLCIVRNLLLGVKASLFESNDLEAAIVDWRGDFSIRQ